MTHISKLMRNNSSAFLSRRFKLFQNGSWRKINHENILQICSTFSRGGWTEDAVSTRSLEGRKSGDYWMQALQSNGKFRWSHNFNNIMDILNEY